MGVTGQVFLVSGTRRASSALRNADRVNRARANSADALRRHVIPSGSSRIERTRAASSMA
jgi:hypothetical protein